MIAHTQHHNKILTRTCNVTVLAHAMLAQNMAYMWFNFWGQVGKNFCCLLFTRKSV